MVGRLSKFSRRYSQFLSEADNDEIVAISKELTGELSGQIRSVSTTAVILLCLSTISLMVSIILAAMIENNHVVYSNYITMMRIAGMMAFIFACILSSSAVSRALKASGISPLLWRNIREAPTDEKAYEQMVAVKKLNKMLYTTRNSLTSATKMTVAGAIATGLSFIFTMFAKMGHI